MALAVGLASGPAGARGESGGTVRIPARAVAWAELGTQSRDGRQWTESRDKGADSKGLSEERAAPRLTPGRKELLVCDAGNTEGRGGVGGEVRNAAGDIWQRPREVPTGSRSQRPGVPWVTWTGGGLQSYQRERRVRKGMSLANEEQASLSGPSFNIYNTFRFTEDETEAQKS